ncbi:MAG: hypothetical protein J2P48_17515, partial [Alphaproteobacteria bacterium]|nr:hypothetical protein [Alphaproteobacteria bacterium]
TFRFHGEWIAARIATNRLGAPLHALAEAFLKASMADPFRLDEIGLRDDPIGELAVYACVRPPGGVPACAGVRQACDSGAICSGSWGLLQYVPRG